MARPFIAVLLTGILFSTGCDQRTPQQHIDDFIKEASKSLPKRLDEGTTLVGYESDELELIYVHTLRGQYEKTALQRKPFVEARVRAALRNNKAVIRAQIRHRIKMTYLYKGSLSDEELFRFTVETWKL